MGGRFLHHHGFALARLTGFAFEFDLEVAFFHLEFRDGVLLHKVDNDFYVFEVHGKWDQRHAVADIDRRWQPQLFWLRQAVFT